MWSLFRLLFSKGYWRTLLGGHTWRESGVAFRRAHKDKRARKRLWATLCLILVPFACVFWLAWVVASEAGLIGGVIALVMMALVSWYRSRKPVEEDGPTTLSLQKYPDATPSPPQVPSGFRTEVAELALLHAVLADRAGSEIFLRTKVLPEGAEVITRRRHLDVLRQYDMLERMGEEERELMLAPDGHWEEGVADNVAFALEPLRLLRWVLRLDAYLPVVGEHLRLNFAVATASMKEPERLFEGEKLVGIEDLRVALQAAEVYFYRCYAEGVRRGFYRTDDAGATTEASAYAERLGREESEDLLLGADIVGQASEQDVRLAGVLSLRRVRVLRWVKERMYGEVEARVPLRTLV